MSSHPRSILGKEQTKAEIQVFILDKIFYQASDPTILGGRKGAACQERIRACLATGRQGRLFGSCVGLGIILESAG